MFIETPFHVGLINGTSVNIDGILTCEGQGRPRIFSGDEEKTIILTLANEPRSIKKVAVEVEQETGKKASLQTLKRVVKELDKC